MNKTNDQIIFEIEDYVAGNIEGVELPDRMSFTRFLRSVLQAKDNQMREIIESVPLDGPVHNPVGGLTNEMCVRAARLISWKQQKLKELNNEQQNKT